MARFYNRRDNQYVSDYAPIPLGLMNQAIQQRQKAKDAAEEGAASIGPLKGEAIKELTINPYQATEDYKRILSVNKEIVDEKNRLNEMISKNDDIEGATRGIMRLKSYQEQLTTQGGDIYNIGESFKKREEYRNTLKDFSKDVKEGYMKKWDEEYNRRGQYKGGVYDRSETIKEIDLRDEVSTYAKAKELDINKSEGSTSFPDIWKMHSTYSDKIKTAAGIKSSLLEMFQTDPTWNENLNARIEFKARNYANNVRLEALRNGKDENEANQEYEQAFRNIKQFEENSLNPESYSVDKEGNVNDKTSKFFGRSIVGGLVAQAAGDFDIKDTQSDFTLTADETRDYDRGGAKKEPKTNITRRQYNVSTISFKYSDLIDKANKIDSEISEITKRLKEARANNSSKTQIESIANELDLKNEEKIGIEGAVKHEVRSNMESYNLPIYNELVENVKNPAFKTNFISITGLQPTSKNILKVASSYTLLDKLSDAYGASNKFTELYGDFREGVDKLYDTKTPFTFTSNALMFTDPSSSAYSWMKTKDATLRADADKIAKKNNTEIDKNTPLEILDFDYDNMKLRFGYRDIKDKMIVVPTTGEFTDEAASHLLSGIKQTLSTSDLEGTTRKSLEDQYVKIKTYKEVAPKLKNANIPALNVGEEINFNVNDGNTPIKFVKIDEFGGGIFKGYVGVYNEATKEYNYAPMTDDDGNPKEIQNTGGLTLETSAYINLE